MSIRLPAEWEKQEMILMAFPHELTDWVDNLQSAYSIFVKIASAICYNQKLIILVHPTIKEKIKDMFCYHDKITFINYESDDTWIRDFGPISIFCDNKRVVKDFLFNAWGGKFEYKKDNLATQYLHKSWIFGISELKKVDFVLEGGSIDSDGNGTILTTTKCLLNPNRNACMTKEEVEIRLKDELGVKKFLWLENGFLVGDDTDSHIDMLARFVSRETIVYIKCYDKNDEHFENLEKMEEELKCFTRNNGKKYNLIPLPLPKAIYKNNQRLPASYANFLITNSSILLPIYRDEKDKEVIEIFKKLFPTREIIPLDSRRLIEEGGSIHCSTMQVCMQSEELR